MAKIVCVLYDDPVKGYPTSYARDSIPKITVYPDDQTAQTPQNTDFNPGEMLGSVCGELGLRKFVESQGHTPIVTSDRDEYLIVDGGKLAGVGAHAYSAGMQREVRKKRPSSKRAAVG